jgi:hypothetical protein
LQVVFRNWIESDHGVINADEGYRSWWIFWRSSFRSRSAPLWRVWLFTGHPIWRERLFDCIPVTRRSKFLRLKSWRRRFGLICSSLPGRTLRWEIPRCHLRIVSKGM